MVDNLTNKDDVKDLEKAFNILNISKNGKLTREELKIAYGNIYNDFPEYANMQVDEIFDRVDIDKSGSIDQDEWIIATIDKSELLSPKKLIQAFNHLDDDGGGTL
jgi:calcium-dependent protein kinase